MRVRKRRDRADWWDRRSARRTKWLTTKGCWTERGSRIRQVNDYFFLIFFVVLTCFNFSEFVYCWSRRHINFRWWRKDQGDNKSKAQSRFANQKATEWQGKIKRYFFKSWSVLMNFYLLTNFLCSILCKSKTLQQECFSRNFLHVFWIFDKFFVVKCFRKYMILISFYLFSWQKRHGLWKIKTGGFG